MNLYQKYRPSDFSEMEGNDSAIKSLQKSLEKENHSHVFLFTGPSGCGKTSSARIMASLVGADEIDIVEINSSNNRGIDTAREIIDQMYLMPLSGKAKAYIIDEVAKTTSDYQNAMLKPLEDTPSHVYFFLCTTDPQKLIKAIRTRCTEVSFEALPSEKIIKVLKRVCKLEGIHITPDILESIADASDGSARKALVLLEQVSSLESEEEMEKFLKEYGSFDAEPEVINLARTLLDSKSTWKQIAPLIKELQASGKMDDPEKVRFAILGYMNAVLLNGATIPRAIIALEAFSQPTYNNGKFGITLAALTVVS